MERLFALVFLLTYWAAPTQANEALLKHTTAVAQAMSALYMEALTQGNRKYEKDLKLHLQVADKYMQDLAASELPEAKAFNKTWLSIKDRLSVEYTEDYEWDVHTEIRREFRRYQTELYDVVNSNSEQYQKPPMIKMLALAQVETIIARFFDISTSFTGTSTLSPIDEKKVDLPVIGKQFNQYMDNMIKAPFYQQQAKKLASAQYKWKFIEKSVVNYSNESAHFLVYATKNKIHKALSVGQELSAN